MKRSRTNTRICYPTESLSETESDDDSEYLKSKLKKVDRSNNNHIIILNDVKATNRLDSIKATDEIDPMSTQWQPKVSLTRLSEKSPNKMLRPAGNVATTTKKPKKNSGKNSGKKSMEKTIVNGIAEISPIKFDKDESIVKEYSPVTANDMFLKRLKSIRDMMIMKEPNTSASQKRKRLLKKPNPELVEYEATRKRLHETTEKKKKLISGGRKLYTHGNFFEESDDEGL